MRVPLLDLGEQYRALADPIRAEIEEVLATQRFILGPKVAAFEEAMAAYCGVPYAIGVSSGTDALLNVLMALELGPGDAVITTPFSFFATAGCIARVDATPVFVDIDPNTFNLSPQALERFLTKECRHRDGKIFTRDGSTVCAILPVHLFGLACDMQEIMRIAREHELLVIEDAAQAVGAEFPWDGRMVKAGSVGDAGCFSFYPSKNLGAAGDAGLITCRNEQLAARFRIFRQHGMEPRYHHQFIGGNFRLDEIQAAILKVKLPSLDGWSATRREIAKFYRRGLSDPSLAISFQAEPFREHDGNHHIYHQFVIRAQRRDELRAHLTQQEIGTEIYYPIPLHLQECFAYLEYKRGEFPEAERAAEEVLALPIYPELKRDAQQFVVDQIAAFYR
ncbi:MAG: DegT/DnrJ/EryC1/StrS family aminotransferase [Verrucomicrobiota bacterium]|nr:DegT/DnrJ/EryC1/StrS family aminotransferase [Verrucomicrobiota bacterium]